MTNKKSQVEPANVIDEKHNNRVDDADLWGEQNNETHSKIVSLVIALDEEDENPKGKNQEQQQKIMRSSKDDDVTENKNPNWIDRKTTAESDVVDEFQTLDDCYSNPNTTSIIVNNFDDKVILQDNDNNNRSDTLNCDGGDDKTCGDDDDADIENNYRINSGNNERQQSINKGITDVYSGIPEATPVEDDDSNYFLTATVIDHERTSTQSSTKTTTTSIVTDNTKNRNYHNRRHKRLVCFGIAIILIIVVAAAVTIGTIRLRNDNNNSNINGNGTESSPTPAPIHDDVKSPHSSVGDGSTSTGSSPIQNNAPYESFVTSADLIFAVDDYVNGRNIQNIVTKYGPIEYWDVSRITTFYTLFDADRNPNTVNFTADLQFWDISSATDLSYMFNRCEQFNADLSKWDTRSVTAMAYMFYGCYEFDSDLSKWNISNVHDMIGFCEDCITFNNGNHSLATWDTSSVTTMQTMFAGTSSFIGTGLNDWDVSSVQDMSYMFTDTLSFDTDLSKWDVSNVTIMESMFSNAVSFRGIGLNKWDTTTRNVITMSHMFWNATNLQATLNLSTWDISNVRYIDYMFADTINFEGIGIMNWKFNPTANIYATGFLCNATAFKTSYIQELTKILSNITDCTNVDNI